MVLVGDDREVDGAAGHLSDVGLPALVVLSRSTDTAIALMLRLSNSPLSAAVRPSSVVHTGVKSAGWLNSTAQESPFQS